MKHLWKSSTIVFLLLSGSGYLFPMEPPPEPKSSFAASIAKYGLLGTGAATLILTLAQRRLPSLSAFAKTGAVAFALVALYKSPALARSLWGLGSQDFDPHVRRSSRDHNFGRPEGFVKALQEIRAKRDAAEERRENQNKYQEVIIASQIEKPAGFNLERQLIQGEPVFFANFNADGKKIIALSQYPCIWDTATKSRMPIGKDQQPGKEDADTFDRQGINSAQFSPDGMHFVTAGFAFFTYLFDAQTGRMICSLKNAPVSKIYQERNANFSADGAKIITSHLNGVRVWDTSTCNEMSLHIRVDNGILYANFTPNGSGIIVVNQQGFLSTYRVSDGTLQSQVRYQKSGNIRKFFDISLDGKKIAFAASETNSELYVFDSTTEKTTIFYEVSVEQVLSAHFSHDGNNVITAGSDGKVCIWDAQSGSLIQTLEGHKGRVYSAFFSPDDTKIVSAGEDEKICIWGKWPPVVRKKVMQSVDKEHQADLNAVQKVLQEFENIRWNPALSLVEKDYKELDQRIDTLKNALMLTTGGLDLIIQWLERFKQRKRIN